MGMTTTQEHLTSAWKKAESDNVTTNTARREAEDKTKKECVAARVTHITEGKSLGLMQVNSMRINNKTLDFCNLNDTCNQDVIGTESWLSGEIRNAEVFRADL
jgi:hypothetical protein